MKTDILTDEVVADMSIRAGFDEFDVTNNYILFGKLRQLTKIITQQMLSEYAEKRSKADETREVTRKQFNELSELVDDIVVGISNSYSNLQIGTKTRQRAEFLERRKQIAELQSKIKRLESED